MKMFIAGFASGAFACWFYFFVYRWQRTKAKIERKLNLLAESVIPSDVLREIGERKGKS